jgi:type II secretory pathway component GspD/PulD (secretin)
MLQMFDTALAQNGIAMVLSGDKAVKAVPVERANLESPPEITLPWSQLPDSSSCMTRTVHLQHFRPSEVVPVLQPFSKLPGSIIPVDGDQVLILRDFSANVRQQLRLLEELEKKQTH